MREASWKRPREEKGNTDTVRRSARGREKTVRITMQSRNIFFHAVRPRIQAIGMQRTGAQLADRACTKGL